MINKYKVLNSLFFGSALLVFSNMALAADPIRVSEPGPMGLLVFGAVALFISRRFTRNK